MEREFARNSHQPFDSHISTDYGAYDWSCSQRDYDVIWDNYQYILEFNAARIISKLKRAIIKVIQVDLIRAKPKFWQLQFQIRLVAG